MPADAAWLAAGVLSSSAIARKILRRWPSEDADLFQVLIGQFGQDREIDVVLGKALRVLGHTELFEPVRNLLHRGPSHEDEGVREFIR